MAEIVDDPPSIGVMHIGFLNPQGNFDAADSYWSEHPDFGGQLVYVKNVAIAMAAAGHRVDIITRLVDDVRFPEFSEQIDAYEGIEGVRIVRIRCGPDDSFLPKESLWPHIVTEWVPNIISFYGGDLPEAFTGHYGDGGLSAALIADATGVPYTFTGHSLGAQKMDKLGANIETLAALNDKYQFATRIAAERLSMNHAAVVITSTTQERMSQYGHTAYAGAIDPEDAGRFAVIPPGVDTQVFSHIPGDADAATGDAIASALARDLSPGRETLPYVVSSSRLDPKKNVTALVAAFAMSPELATRANLVLFTGSIEDPLRADGTAGPTEAAELAAIRSTIADGDLTGKVAGISIRGQASLAAAYRWFAARHGVFALTALYEPFGLAPLEAAAAGLPVVVTKNGGPSESMVDATTEYGVLVDPEDPLDIARGLMSALDRWSHFAEAGRGRVLAMYTWDATARAYLDAISRAASPAHSERIAIHPFFAGGATPPSIDELTDWYQPS